MTIENISWSISTKECCRPRQGLNPRPPGLQSDGASNWATEAGSYSELGYRTQWCCNCVMQTWVRQCIARMIWVFIIYHKIPFLKKLLLQGKVKILMRQMTSCICCSNEWMCFYCNVHQVWAKLTIQVLHKWTEMEQTSHHICASPPQLQIREVSIQYFSYLSTKTYVMGTHSICFCGQIGKISVHFGWKKCLIWRYDLHTSLQFWPLVTTDIEADLGFYCFHMG